MDDDASIKLRFHLYLDIIWSQVKMKIKYELVCIYYPKESKIEFRLTHCVQLGLTRGSYRPGISAPLLWLYTSGLEGFS